MVVRCQLDMSYIFKRYCFLRNTMTQDYENSLKNLGNKLNRQKKYGRKSNLNYLLQYILQNICVSVTIVYRKISNRFAEVKTTLQF